MRMRSVRTEHVQEMSVVRLWSSFFVTVFLVGLSLTVDSSMEKRVLVSVGENTRVVPFSTPPASDCSYGQS